MEVAKVWARTGAVLNADVIGLAAIIGVAVFVVSAFPERIANPSVRRADAAGLVTHGDGFAVIAFGALIDTGCSGITGAGTKRFELIIARHAEA